MKRPTDAELETLLRIAADRAESAAAALDHAATLPDYEPGTENGASIRAYEVVPLRTAADALAAAHRAAVDALPSSPWEAKVERAAAALYAGAVAGGRYDHRHPDGTLTRDHVPAFAQQGKLLRGYWLSKASRVLRAAGVEGA